MKLAPQVFVSHSKPEAGKIDPIMDASFWKPRGGLWTSTLDDAGGQWLRFVIDNYELENERWGGKLWLLQPKEANLFTIWSPKEYNELVERFPRSFVGEQSSIGEMNLIDWVAIQEFYDGIYMPNPWTWRFGHENLGAGVFFYSLDAESTCWFRWRFTGQPQELDPAPYLAKLNGDD